jgi:hypothetical protein
VTLPPPSRQVVYVAAPFGGDVEANTREAVRVCRLLQADGYAPICLHPAILAGAYGSDDDPADREAGLATCEAIVVRCAFVVAVETPCGALSPGTAQECLAARWAGVPVYRVPWRWRSWA